MALDDVVDHRAGVVRPGGRVHRDRHRRAPAGSDQGGRCPHRVLRDVVERPELVIAAPAAPVLDRLEDLVELPQRHPGGLSQRRHRPARLLVSHTACRRNWSYAARGFRDSCTTALTALIIATGSSLWKMFRPMSTPAAPSSMARYAIVSASSSGSFFPPAMTSGTGQAAATVSKSSAQ